MRLTSRTRTREIFPLLNEDRLAFILDRVPAVPLKKPVISMTVGEYVEALDPKHALKVMGHRRAFVALGRLKQFRKEMEEVARWLEAHSLPAEPSDTAAMAGVDFPTAQESILLETREAFGLPRLDSTGRIARWFGVYGAADIPLAEYLLTLKGKVAGAKFDRNRSRQMEAQMKRRAR